MRHPAGERVERLVLRLLVEAEAGENARGPRRRAMGIDDVQPLVNLADAVRIGGVLDPSSRLDGSVAAASTVANGVPSPPRASWAT
jgi:hypothetical protein